MQLPLPSRARRSLRSRPRVEELEARENPTAAFALSGANLLRFDLAAPTITQTTAIIGNLTVGETLVGIDFRPQNGFLYGLGVNATANTASLYAISTRTGFAAVAALGNASAISFVDASGSPVDLPDPATVGYGFDFNPATDRVRVVAGSLNFRIDPNTALPIDGDNTGLTSGTVTGTNPDGPINTGTTTVDAAAYTNNQPNTTVTTLYTLDASTDSLFIQNPPNAGTQTMGQTVTLGGSTLNFTAINGFDINAGVNAPSSNAAVTAGSAFAVLNVGGVTGLYSINLPNAQATFIGNVGNGATAVQGLAVQQTSLGGLPAVSLTATGLNLSRFNTSTPTNVTAPTISGVTAGEQLVGIDFGPQTGRLYGLGVNATANTGTLYLIDPQTGVVTAVGTASQIAFVDAGGSPVDLPDPTTAGYGFDFNPTVDRIRVTTSTGLNFRINPNSGSPVDGDLGGVAGSVAGINTDANINGSGVTGISATAYTNSFGQALTGPATTLYTLDATTDSLYIQQPANAGTQISPLPVTLGGSALNFTNANGFDIPAGIRVATSGNAVTSGRGFAVLNVGGISGLYLINLVTGVATSLGTVGGGAALAGLTLADAPAGTIAFTAATFSVSEAGPTANITLTRSDGSFGALTVMVNVTGGTATAGSDFTAGPYTATFANEVSSASFSIPITDDANFEGSETIILTIASVDNAGVIGSPNVTTLTITDNDVFVTGANTSEDAQTTSGLVISQGGTDVTHVKITNITNGTLFQNDGTTPIAAGSFIAVAQANAGLKFTPTANFNGTGSFDVQGSTSNTNGGLGGNVATATITVSAVNDAPVANPDSFTTAENTPLNVAAPGVLGNDTDVDGPAQTAVLVSNVANGVLGLNANGSFTYTPNLNFNGTDSFTYRVNDTAAANNLSNIVTVTITITAVENALVVTAGGAGSNGVVTVTNPNGTTRFSLTPYAGFTGGVRVAVGDVTGDSVVDIITGTGAGGAPHVKVFDGVTGAEIRSFFAFSPAFLGGVSVASADIDGDTVADIIVGAGPGAGPHVKVFSGATGAEIRSFFAYGAAFTGGVNVAGGDIDNDGNADIVTGTVFGAPHVKVFDGLTHALHQSFFAYSQASNGVNVATALIGGIDTLVTGSGSGIAPSVQVYNANGTVRGSFAPYAASFLGGVRVAGNVDGKIVTGAGPGAGPHVKVFDGTTFAELESFFAQAPSFTGGVYVG